MCGTCGCGAEAEVRLHAEPSADIVDRRHEARDDDGHEHDPHGGDGHERHGRGGDGHERHGHGNDGGSRAVILRHKVLAKNDALAERNRDWLRRRGIVAVNLMSSPGAGKTTLLERTARELADQLVMSVIEGDQETALDAQRIRSAGCRVVQVNTGSGCHLDAAMVARGLQALDPPSGSVVVIENVGNLVCPALFDLGEAARVVIASVAEGGDKPLKYPQMFRRADLVLVNKTDLLPYVDFDLGRYRTDVSRVSPGATMLQLSATTGDGMPQWYDWLGRGAVRPGAPG